MKHPLIIGIAGKKHSGKDTFAKMVCWYLNYTHSVIHFADALKEECARMLHEDVKTIEANKEVFRPMLQWYGTEYRRKFKNTDNYWVARVAETVSKATLLGTYVVLIPDVRFLNEVEWLRKEGGILVHLNRATNSGDSHSSETTLDGYQGFDYVIMNNGTLEDLEAKAKEFAERVVPSLLIGPQP